MKQKIDINVTISLKQTVEQDGASRCLLPNIDEDNLRQDISRCIDTDMISTTIANSCNPKQNDKSLTAGQPIPVDPDFYAFANTIALDMLKAGKRRGNDIMTVIRSMMDYHPNPLPVSKLDRRVIKGYCDFCRTEHTIIRKDQFGRMRQSISKPIMEETINYRLKVIKSIIHKIKVAYSDVTGYSPIKNNVFAFYKLSQPKPSRHDRVVPIEVIRKLIGYHPTTKKQQMAKDLFLLSLLTCGTNLIDYYDMCSECINGDKLTYSRSKTADKRYDYATITVFLSPFVLSIVEKYRDETKEKLLRLHRMYSCLNNLQKAVSGGLKQIKEAIGYDGSLTYYCARHTFATIAANDLGVPVETVGRCLNHSQKTVTSFYIKPDFEDVWNVQKAVENLILEVLAH